MNRTSSLMLAWFALTAGCGDLHEGNLLDGSGKIQGQVKTAEGAAVQAARVHVLKDLSLYDSTDEGGAFLLQEVPAGIHTVVATTEEGLGASVEAKVFGDETTTVEILLAPTGRIHGSVTLEGEQDHTGTLIYLPGTSFAGFTDDDGGFALVWVVPGCYRLIAGHTGFHPKELERVCVESGGEKTLQEITLLRRGTPECTRDDDCDDHQVCRDGACVFEEGYTTEACDGEDNDGDGYVDEGIAEPCGTGEGACVEGISLCLGGSMTDCLGEIAPEEEACGDAQDNDCDGDTDEGCPVQCGDGRCSEGETPASCPEDCHCGDGTCEEERSEDPCTCPADCTNPVPECCVDADCPPPICGACCSAACIPGTYVCQDVWEPDCCWNNECEPGETPDTCPEDCGPPGCPNTYCDDGETTVSCPQDCCPPMSDACAQAGWQGVPFCMGPDLFDCALACRPACGCDEQLVLVEAGADACVECVPEGMPLGPDGACCDGLDVLNSNFVPDAGSCTGSYCWEPVCADCGDDTCGPGENYCSCPDDCGGLSCVEELGLAMSDLGIFDCCPGLIPVDMTADGCNQYMCVDCGDGVCGPGETSENCLADCGPCAQEGALLDPGDARQCCSDLTPLSLYQAIEDGACMHVIFGVTWHVCTRCGDGSCGLGENFCSCPADCTDTCVTTDGVMVGDQGCCDGNPFVRAVPQTDPLYNIFACVLCGNGSCDYGETEVNCPEDCSLECFPDGHPLPRGGTCCPGLSALNSNWSADNGTCTGSWCGWCWYPICADCGDGACGPGENYCSCPDDCDSLTCVHELGIAMTDQDIDDCCPGLIQVDVPGDLGGSLYMCVDCGDGDCGHGENSTNCPGDCGR